MNEEFLLQAIGHIDEELIIQAEAYRPAKRPSLRRPLSALAACAAVAFVLYWGAGSLRMGSANSGSTSVGGEASSNTANGGATQESTSSGSADSSLDSYTSEDWRPAIMVDGQLYWSTGQVLSGQEDASAILGTTTYTDGLPDQDGQANFDQDGTLYARTADGIAVQMDGEWVLFTADGP